MDKVIEVMGNSLNSENGFEIYPFKIAWYNEVVDPVFRLPYSEDSFAVLVLSVPKMFEQTFVPWLKEKYAGIPLEELETQLKDPLDECMKEHFNRVVKELEKETATTSIEVIHDMDLMPNRRPRILMPTCGHIAGAAYYYQKSQLSVDPWPNKKALGLALHPSFGGWFAFRGVFIFPNLEVPHSMQQKPPLNVLKNEDKIQIALEKFIFHWADWTYRDVSDPIERYSDNQKDYFGTLPGSRWKVVQKIIKD